MFGVFAEIAKIESSSADFSNRNKATSLYTILH
jgi:hypothetical protein